MTALVVGASGVIERLLVKQLLSCGLNIKVIVRAADKLSKDSTPIRSAIFDILDKFRADLISDPGTWNKWKGQMPIIYNKVSS